MYGRNTRPSAYRQAPESRNAGLQEGGIAGDEHLKSLGSIFRLHSLDSLLLELLQGEPRNGSRLEQGIVLLTRSICPKVLQLRMESRDENLIRTVQSNIGRGLEVEFVERLISPTFSYHRFHHWAYE